MHLNSIKGRAAAELATKKAAQNEHMRCFIISPRASRSLQQVDNLKFKKQTNTQKQKQQQQQQKQVMTSTTYTLCRAIICAATASPPKKKVGANIWVKYDEARIKREKLQEAGSYWTDSCMMLNVGKVELCERKIIPNIRKCHLI